MWVEEGLDLGHKEKKGQKDVEKKGGWRQKVKKT